MGIEAQGGSSFEPLCAPRGAYHPVLSCSDVRSTSNNSPITSGSLVMRAASPLTEEEEAQDNELCLAYLGGLDTSCCFRLTHLKPTVSCSEHLANAIQFEDALEESEGLLVGAATTTASKYKLHTSSSNGCIALQATHLMNRMSEPANFSTVLAACSVRHSHTDFLSANELPPV